VQAHVETTDQNYTNWSMSNNFTLLCLAEGGQGIIQPTLTEVAPGEILVLVRTSGCGVIAMSKSYDYGRTFSHPANETSLPNPGAGIDRCVVVCRVLSCLAACVWLIHTRVWSAVALRCALLMLVVLLLCCAAC
jgi:predicted neuraminidase